MQSRHELRDMQAVVRGATHAPSSSFGGDHRRLAAAQSQDLQGRMCVAVVVRCIVAAERRGHGGALQLLLDGGRLVESGPADGVHHKFRAEIHPATIATGFAF